MKRKGGGGNVQRKKTPSVLINTCKKNVVKDSRREVAVRWQGYWESSLAFNPAPPFCETTLGQASESFSLSEKWASTTGSRVALRTERTRQTLSHLQRLRPGKHSAKHITDSCYVGSCGDAAQQDPLPPTSYPPSHLPHIAQDHSWLYIQGTIYGACVQTTVTVAATCKALTSVLSLALLYKQYQQGSAQN